MKQEKKKKSENITENGIRARRGRITFIAVGACQSRQAETRVPAARQRLARGPEAARLG